ncbi:RNA polymerase-associated protein RTF1 homolog [Clavelina lepadiformis]|uniref:RNA polymerase-associated protein RTF1 homolog n=1 Tax=Clavelina lepadiformis TaxID=159417 RepID=UPI0040436675
MKDNILDKEICCFIVLVRLHSKIDKTYGRDIILSDLTGFQIELLHIQVEGKQLSNLQDKERYLSSAKSDSVSFVSFKLKLSFLIEMKMFQILGNATLFHGVAESLNTLFNIEFICNKMSSKRKNPFFSDSDESGSEDFLQIDSSSANHRMSGITSSKPKMRTSTTNSFDEEALRKKFDDGYDSDLVGDEMDRRRLSNMTEKERELEFYNRLERREALQKRFEVEKKLLLGKQRGEGEKYQQKRKKQKISVASPPSSLPDAFDRKRIMGKRKENEALEKLKAERQRKKNKVVKTKLQVSAVYSDDGDDEMPMTRSRPAATVPSSTDTNFHRELAYTSDEDGQDNIVTMQPPLSKDKVSTIRLSRFRLEKWFYLPMFREVVLGCYVRIGIGSHEGKPVYRMAEIVDVVETAKIYHLGKVRTNLGFRLKHGQQTRVFRLEFISNSKLTDSEFSKWKQAMEEAGESLPTFDDIKKKQAAINKARSYIFKDTDIDRIVKEKSRFRKTPINYARSKTDIMRQIDIALERDDAVEATRLVDVLKDLEERATQLDNQRQNHLAGTTYINKRIKSHNLQKVKAYKEEWKVPRNNEADPFTRKKCKPLLMCNTKDGKQKERLLQEIDKLYGTGSSESNSDPEPSNMATAQPKHMSEDRLDVHDFDLNIDLQMLSADEKPSATKLNPSSEISDNPHHSIGFAKCKKRKALI